jgi:hypothetical protein
VISSDESIDTDGFISLVEPAMVPKFLNDFLANPKGILEKNLQNSDTMQNLGSVGLGPCV